LVTISKMVKIALLFAIVLVWVSADIGERKGVTISLKGEGTDLMLATEEDLGSFWCGASCEYVFTTDSKSDDTVWDIIPYKHGEEDCYKIVKAKGVSVGQMMGCAHNNLWKAPFGDGKPKLYTNSAEDESKCWEFVNAGGDNYKIKSKLGQTAGKSIKARPINFKEQSVSKMRRFVEVSDDDNDNVWQVKNA